MALYVPVKELPSFKVKFLRWNRVLSVIRNILSYLLFSVVQFVVCFFVRLMFHLYSVAYERIPDL
jgi:hypothetical protein